MRSLILIPFTVTMAAAAPSIDDPKFYTPEGCRAALAQAIQDAEPQGRNTHGILARRLPPAVRDDALRFAEIQDEIQALREEAAQALMRACAAY